MRTRWVGPLFWLSGVQATQAVGSFQNSEIWQGAVCVVFAVALAVFGRMELREVAR